jgi:hypothetical protein
MKELDTFEKEIQDQLYLSDKDSMKMARLLTDIESVIGLSTGELLEFLRFGAKEELEILHRDYDWNWFARTIITRLEAKR